jgi:hypothetical protein
MGRLRLGKVIATRRLIIVGERPRPVTVRIGRPRRVRVGEWACPVEFSGLGELQGVAGRGVDSCQALVDALAGIHYSLAESGYKFSWSSVDGETGFPRAVPYGFGPEFAARVRQHIDRELERFIRATKRRRNRKAITRRRTGPPNMAMDPTPRGPLARPARAGHRQR